MFNQITIIGRVTTDIALREVQGRDGMVKVCNFNVATNDRNQGRDASGAIKPCYFRVAVWNGMAETAAKYLSKGRLVTVTGTVAMTSSIGQNGQVYYGMEIRNAEITFMPDTVRHTPVQGTPENAPVQQNTPVATQQAAPVAQVARPMSGIEQELAEAPNMEDFVLPF